jgi:hypothetical protein
MSGSRPLHPPIADIRRDSWNVCLGPLSDITALLFDHLVGKLLELRWYIEAESGEVPFEQNGHQSAHRCGRSRRVTAAALLPSGGRVAGPEHDDFRADWRAVVEIDDVLVRQADTAGRDVGANGPGFIGAVDAV